VVESTHEDPREAAIKMQESLLARPGLFKEGFMDQSFARFFVLLHDGHNDRRAYVVVVVVLLARVACCLCCRASIG